MSNAVATKKDAPIHRGEIALLAREMASCYTGMVKYFEKEYKLSHARAKKKANSTSEAYWEIVEGKPPREIGFYQLQSYHERKPKEALEKWGAIKRAAADELASFIVSGPDGSMRDATPVLPAAPASVLSMNARAADD